MDTDIKEDIKIAESTEVLDESKSNKNPRKNLFIGFAVMLFLAVGVFASNMLLQDQVDIRQRASETNTTIAYLAFSPGEVRVSAADLAAKKVVNLSVIAYNTSNTPIYDLASYQWGISSTASIGTLKNTNGAIATFVPQNTGYGDIFVTAKVGTQTYTQSIPVYVGITQKPTSLPSPTLLPSPTIFTSPTTFVDSVSPVVTINSPLGGSRVATKSTINIQATASDNVGITKVEFYINNLLNCTDSAAPYICSWKVPNASNKKYTITAKAYDARLNNSQATISVTSK